VWLRSGAVLLRLWLRTPLNGEFSALLPWLSALPIKVTGRGGGLALVWAIVIASSALEHPFTPAPVMARYRLNALDNLAQNLTAFFHNRYLLCFLLAGWRSGVDSAWIKPVRADGGRAFHDMDCKRLPVAKRSAKLTGARLSKPCVFFLVAPRTCRA